MSTQVTSWWIKGPLQIIYRIKKNYLELLDSFIIRNNSKIDYELNDKRAFLVCQSIHLTITNSGKRIQAMQWRCQPRLLVISYRDNLTNDLVRERITSSINPLKSLLSMAKTRNLRSNGHVTRINGLSKNIMQGTVPGERRKRRQRRHSMDDIKDWTGLHVQNYSEQ